ncbi:ParB/RepB/Spo0J family partition protein [Pseudoalteromonas luteoviolacea]|uniref:ParB/RepB/Spo0J family partition protein n=1 Tax=Pseudoalteromonas luteoviolacea TaxID=43657 RepID=UPI001B378621|nr:ParB/RepB/Spo0J family partition protein [Pseudoalteromonas luteoviolacea]MBQ4840011.1 ParB/RepB/Spo0J family partition protein [Pseudoalteromonas luteoviolacea]
MEKLENIKLDDLIPDPNQPRKDFDEEKLEELSNSIAAVGVIQPIRVRRNPEASIGKPAFMIIAGERRWQASQKAGKDTIPAVIIEDENALTDDAIYAHQLTENLHRQDLNPVEKAEFINGRIEYLKEQGVTNAIEQAAQELGVSPSWVSKNTAILKYEPEIRALARDGKLRDYSLLKKISGLRSDKKQQAIELIESGEFNAKEFFARKRYDKKPSAKEEQGEGGSVSLAKSEGKEQGKPAPFKLQFGHEEFVKLIDKTGYSSMMDRHDPDWRKASPAIMKSYVEKFKEWVVETD